MSATVCIKEVYFAHTTTSFKTLGVLLFWEPQPPPMTTPETKTVIQAIWDAMPPKGTEMYNFYEKDVRTLEEVKEYLRTWFTRQPGGSREWNGSHYTSVMGFRRGYCRHQVFVNTATGRYIFTCEEEKMIPPFVTGEWTSFEAVIDDIAAYFAKVWKITA